MIKVNCWDGKVFDISLEMYNRILSILANREDHNQTASVTVLSTEAVWSGSTLLFIWDQKQTAPNQGLRCLPFCLHVLDAFNTQY